MMIRMHDSCSGPEILISGNFPEIAWRAIYSRQTAHANCVGLGCFWGQRLSVGPCTVRRRKWVIRFWAYFYDLPGSDEFPPGDASLLTQFSGSVLFGRILIGENGGNW